MLVCGFTDTFDFWKNRRVLRLDFDFGPALLFPSRLSCDWGTSIRTGVGDECALGTLVDLWYWASDT